MCFFVNILTTPPIALDPYKVDIAPSTTSILSTLLKLNIEKSILPAIEKGIEPQPPDRVLHEWLEKYGPDNEKRLSWAGLLLDALENIDRADITTIHGFCKRTLEREALASSSAMNLRLEGEGKELIFEVVNDYWQQQLLDLDPEHLKGLKDACLTIDRLSQAVLKIDSDSKSDIYSIIEFYSTVTDFAKFLGLSISQFFNEAT